jgi:hypothetical protein
MLFNASVSRLIAAVMMVSCIGTAIPAIAVGKQPQKTSKSAKETAKKQQKKAEIAQGTKDSKARKDMTGRERQGNHDSLTKPNVRGGPKGDRHDNGIKQAGNAGNSK